MLEAEEDKFNSVMGRRTNNCVAHLFTVLEVVHALPLIALLDPLAINLHDQGRRGRRREQRVSDQTLLGFF